MYPAISNLYSTFKPYRLGGDFTGCDCCVSNDESVRLATLPLRDLTVGDLNRYAFKSMTTWGTERHFNYFLPRLFELLLFDYSRFDFPEVLIGKLSYANWQEWSENEQAAVHEYLRFLWGYHLEIPPDYEGDDRIATILAAISSATGSMDPFLEILLSQDSVNSAQHIRELIEDLADDIMQGNGKDLASSSEFIEWLISDKVDQYLRRFETDIIAKSPMLFDRLTGIRSAVVSRR